MQTLRTFPKFIRILSALHGIVNYVTIVIPAFVRKYSKTPIYINFFLIIPTIQIRSSNLPKLNLDFHHKNQYHTVNLRL